MRAGSDEAERNFMMMALSLDIQVERTEDEFVDIGFSIRRSNATA